MGVAVKTELGVLVIKARGGIELVEDVAPFVRGIEGGVDDGEIAHLADHFEVAEPLLVGFGKLVAGPVDGLFGEWVEADEVVHDRGLLVVVSLDHGAVELAHDVEAFAGVGVVADDVAEADVVGDLVLFGVGEDGLEGLEIGVDVSEDGESHVRGLREEYLFSARREHPIFPAIRQAA